MNSCKRTDNTVSWACRMIECYKIFAVDREGNYYGPYTGHCYGKLKEFDILAVPEPVRFLGIQIWNREEIFKSDGIWHITKGFIHTVPNDITLDKSYSSPQKAIKDYLGNCMYSKATGIRYEFWEAVIPVGTKYYEGNTRRSHYELSHTYASKIIMLSRKIAETT